jgi:hypothetical protein
MEAAMPASEETRVASATDDGERREPDATQSHATVQDLTADQLAKWSRLVAGGETGFPDNLAPVLEERMANEVRRLSRKRLISLIARQIAMHIHRDGRQDEEVKQ